MGISVISAVTSALDTSSIKIESSFTCGFAGIHLLGNTAEVSQDGKERARAALENLGLRFPARKLLINITPADIRANGNQLDLPFAISLATLLHEKPPMGDLSSIMFVGELGLDGAIRPVKGAISYAIAAVRQGYKGIVVSSANLPELSVLKGFNLPHLNRLDVWGFHDLRSVLEWVWSGVRTGGVTVDQVANADLDLSPKVADYDDMVLSDEQELAAMVAAVGQHSMLLNGVPGTGKSMFAQRLVAILPRMEQSQHLQALCIHNTVSERIQPTLLSGVPPFRSPHHQASTTAILGGLDSPGELSLAHGGILFLDEFPEFRRDLVEALREPLESGAVHVARAHGKVSWHAQTMLVAAANSCPCGWYGSRVRKCRCATPTVLAYRNRLSGPILERIDMHLNFPEREQGSFEFLQQILCQKGQGRSRLMRERVELARGRARERNHRWNCQLNRELAASVLIEASGQSSAEFARLCRAVIPASASNRNIIKALRVARSLADLRESEKLAETDLRQAWRWQGEIDGLRANSL